MESPPHAAAQTPRFSVIFNRHGRLRSGWRFAAFVVVFLVILILLAGAARALYSFLKSQGVVAGFPPGSRWGFVLQHLFVLPSATLAGWLCGYALEGLPRRALGWALHRRWARDLLVGSLVGGASLAVAALVNVIAGGTWFFPTDAGLAAVLDTLVVSAAVFMVGAAAEEALFRGYPLQTMLRPLPAWLALVPTSLLFAAIHLRNPNVARGFTFLNTVLAGVWLTVAYLRTRSLWFPLGVHWGWNWTMGSLLGIPVSGITRLTPAPVLRAVDTGPSWLTGGHYGIEGGLACTLALLLSTAFIWRTRLVSADPEQKRLTDRENPAPVPAATVAYTFSPDAPGPISHDDTPSEQQTEPRQDD